MRKILASRPGCGTRRGRSPASSVIVLAIGVAALLLTLLPAAPGATAAPLPLCVGPAVPGAPVGEKGLAATPDTEPSTYYAVELVPTRRVPGTRRSTGTATVTFERSPFGVSVAPDGSYSYSIEVEVEGLRARDDADYVVWVTRSDLSEIRRVGILDEAGRIEGEVAWNKFLVVVTLEPGDAPVDADTWEGPVVLRGMSRSGRMHTMAGHGPFQAEPCVKYGYQ